MKKRLTVCLLAVIMLFVGFTNVKAGPFEDIIGGITNTVNNLMSDETVQQIGGQVANYIANNPEVVNDIIGDDYQYIYVGITSDEYNKIQEIIASGATEGGYDVRALVPYILNNDISELVALKDRIVNAEPRDIVTGEGQEASYNLPVDTEQYVYYVLIPVKKENVNQETGKVSKDDIISSIEENIPSNSNSNTTNAGASNSTNSNNKSTVKTTTTAASKKTVKNPKTGDVLFTILGTITLAGAGFVVTLKKAKQR